MDMSKLLYLFDIFLVVNLVISGCCLVRASNSYAITGPGTYQSGVDFRSSVSILGGSSSVNVTAFLRDGSSTLSSDSKILSKGQTDLFTLTVPSSTKLHSISVDYVGSGGLSFNKSTSLPRLKTVYTLIQTDRRIYAENEEVKFRVVVLHTDLTPYSGAVDVSVKNSEQSIVESWTSLSTRMGVVEKTFNVGSHPDKGKWTISATADGHTKEKSIEVRRYVIPKFNVTISGPISYTISTKKLTYNISAKYTFLKDVFGLLHCQAYTASELLVNETKDISGETQFVVSKFPLTLGVPINVVCQVGERGSGTTVSDGLEVTFKKEISDAEKWKIFPTKTSMRPGLYFKSFFRFPKSASGKKATLQIRQTEKMIKTCTLQTPSFHYVSSEREVTLDEYVVVDSNGYAEWLHKVGQNVTNIFIHASVDSINIYTGLMSVLSPYKRYINMMPRQPTAKVGLPYIVDVAFNYAMTSPIVYQIEGRGLQLYRGQIQPTQGSRESELRVPVTDILVPEFKIVILCTTPEGEVIADSMVVPADGDPMMNNVLLNYSNGTVRPGDSVNISISTAPNSTVFLLSIDEGAEIISKGHDIYSSDIKDDLLASSFYESTYSSVVSWNLPKYYKFKFRSTIDSSNILQDAGIYIMSDFRLIQYDPENTVECEPEVIIRQPTLLPGMTYSPMLSVPWTALKADSFRQNFKTTWLWKTIEVGPSGSITINSKVPDSITSWITSAFAMNKRYGIGMLKVPKKLTVFKDIFMDVRFPEFAYVNETIVLTVTVFNNINSPKQFFISGNYTGAESVMDNIFTGMKVDANSQNTVFLPIKVKSPGPTIVTMWLQSFPDLFNKVDGVRQEFIVKSGGVEQRHNVPTLCSLGRLHPSCQKTINIHFPLNVVPNSRQISIKVTGNIMVPTIDGLHKLIKQPTGCGEQTMVDLVPNIFVMKYLTATCKLTNGIRLKLLNNMNEGVTHELTWRRNDGSYSAWGQRDSYGNTWLTAYVTLSFMEASEFIQVDPYAIRSAVRFLINNQKSDGSFSEQRLRYDVFMQGGTITNAVTMTSFVLLALNAAEKMPNLGVNIDKAIENGKRYLERNINYQEDPYSLAIGSYTLKMLHSSLSVNALQKLKTKRKNDHDSAYWTSNFYVKRRSTSWHPNEIQKTDRTIDIETTAYALLAHVVHQDADNAAQIMKWLIFQRNPTGGFLSSQDTVVGLRALSEYSMMTANCNNNAQRTQVQVTTSLGHNMRITEDNKDVVQHFDIPVNTSSLTINAQGEGTALIDVVTYYNVEAVSPATFNVYSSKILSETFVRIKAEVCIRRNDKDKNGMVVVEISIPTGFQADMEAIHTTGAPSRHSENGVDKINLYFDEIPNSGSCIIFASDRVGKATHAGKLPVVVYDYYQPSNQGLGYYESGNLTNLDLCTICKECQACHQIIG